MVESNTMVPQVQVANAGIPKGAPYSQLPIMQMANKLKYQLHGTNPNTNFSTKVCSN